MADPENKNNEEKRDTQQEYLDSMFEPGELEAIVAYHTNEDGYHEPKLPPDWTEEDSIAAKARIEKEIGSYRRYKMDVSRDALVSMLVNRADVPAGYPTAKESMQLPYDKRFRGYDELRDWFVERGYDIPEADLAAELEEGYIGTYDDVFEELQTVEAKESYGGDSDDDQNIKSYLLKLRELGVTKIDTEYHRTRRAMLADDPVAHELAIRMQRQNPSEIMVSNNIYAHDVEVEGMDCPEPLRRNDIDRHLFNPDGLDYVGYKDNRHEDEEKESEIDPMAPSPIPEILKDLDDYAPGGPKQYRRPPEDIEEQDLTYNSEDGDFVSPKEPDNSSEDEKKDEKTSKFTDDNKKSESEKAKKFEFKENKGEKEDSQRAPQQRQMHGSPYMGGGGSVMPSDMLGFGALANLVGKGVKGAANLTGKAASKGASMISERRGSERANSMAKIAINEITRANASAKDALNRVQTGTNKSGEPASDLEKSQNIAELDLSLSNLGKKLKMGESSAKNTKVGFDEKRKLLETSVRLERLLRM